MVLAMSEGSWALLHAPAPVLEEQQVAWAAHALGAAIGVPLAFLLFTGNYIETFRLPCRDPKIIDRRVFLECVSD